MGLPIPDNPDPIIRLREIVHCLRAPGGCPWDIEQTHESLIANLLEEAYEVAAAIRSEDTEHMVEELGDLLLQVVMHAEIASETDRFVLEDIARGVGDKLVRRHPHVFGESDASDTETVLKQWEAIKLKEKGDKPRPYLKDVGEGLPALMTATKLQKKAAKVGFDWDNPDEVFAKVKEEVTELEAAFKEEKTDHIAEEFGDLFFSLVNLARKHGLDSESILADANEKFRRRFHCVEKQLSKQGQTLEGASLAEMDAAWKQAKVSE
ncbi:MAG: nucleoside triphosphate pyrophosphohydrolase [Verrucomicrobiales bacterium]|nr:nucleoside triphosphate pyrophosphohydrolase [Verrucomicrobiales bacterium]